MAPYELQLIQHLQDTDKSARLDFCIAKQENLEDNGFDDRFFFNDEAAFHVNDIWGTENPHGILEHQ